MIRKAVAAGAVALLLAVSTPAAAERVCKVVGIADGDTMTVLCAEREQMKIRIAEIDAPEKKQPFGTRSKQSLSDLCFGKEAVVFPEKKDRYGRTIARVKCGGTDASVHQVQTGMAWVYDRYVTDRSLYTLQSLARTKGQGLWAEALALPPWSWRREVIGKKFSQKLRILCDKCENFPSEPAYVARVQGAELQVDPRRASTQFGSQP